MTIHYKEDTLTLSLERDSWFALVEALEQRTTAIETDMDEGYTTQGLKVETVDLLVLRDLRLLQSVLLKKVEQMYTHDRTKAKVTLTITQVLLLHTQITNSCFEPFLQLAIDHIDQSIKSYPLQYRFLLRKP